MLFCLLFVLVVNLSLACVEMQVGRVQNGNDQVGDDVMSFVKAFKGLLTLSCLVLMVSNANAAIWTVQSVNGGDDSRLFNTSDLGTYALVTGLTEGKISTFNDVTGVLDLWVDIDAVAAGDKAAINGSYNVSGMFNFDLSKTFRELLSTATIDVINGASAVGDSYIFARGLQFDSAFQANSSTVFPAAGGQPAVAYFDLYGKSEDGLRGVDIALYLEATAVPLPAAAWLFGSALLGVFGLRRRK